MNFSAFLAYCQLYDSGKLWQEMTYKNYDLLWQAGTKRLWKALRDCGFGGDEVSMAVAECATRVRDRGFHLSNETVRILLLEWYVWRGLKRGEYKKWKYRKTDK